MAGENFLEYASENYGIDKIGDYIASISANTKVIDNPARKTVGPNGTGPFSEIGACRSASQTGCVVAYNAFSQPPPSAALFGRPDPPVLNGITQQEVCTNPAALAGGTGTLVSAYRVQLPTQEVAGSATEGILNYYPAASTPWIQFDDQYSASCVKSNGADVLMVTSIHDGSQRQQEPHLRMAEIAIAADAASTSSSIRRAAAASCGVGSFLTGRHTQTVARTTTVRRFAHSPAWAGLIAAGKHRAGARPPRL